jgi:hypothetical protein
MHDSDDRVAKQAISGLPKVDPMARLAIPTLRKIVQHPTRRHAALSALAQLARGEESMLTELLKLLNRAEREDDVALLTQLASLLGYMANEKNQQRILPLMRRLLRDKRSPKGSAVSVQQATISGILLMGRLAKPVVPELLKLIEDSNDPPGKNMRLLEALMKIDPDAVGAFRKPRN